MSVGTPDNSTQVEDRIKADVQRSAPDSNPYLFVHWLRSLIAGIARRIFDFYSDLSRTEKRLLPDTADAETAPIWGNIYVGPQNPATTSSGELVATGTVGGIVGIGETLAVEGEDYITTSADTISLKALPVVSITRSGTTASVITSAPHKLASFVPVDLTGATQVEYNVAGAAITVTGLFSFDYEIVGSPVTPATGTISAGFTTANVDVDSVEANAEVNLDADTALTLQSPIVDVDDTLFVTFGAVGGGSDIETIVEYITRYLEKIRKTVANFNEADISQQAKTVTGVTRVFVESAGTTVGSIVLASLTRNGNVVTAVSISPHGFEDGQTTTVNGATEAAYNVTDERIIVEDDVTFHYVAFGAPSSPATGTATAAAKIPLGQVRTMFMRDNDPDPIPTASEVQDVKDQIEKIRPANTASADNIVVAPVAVPTNYQFTSITPNTPTMRTAVEASLAQFHAETVPSVNADEGAYRAAIQSTVDPDTGDILESFGLLVPVGDLLVNSGEISTKGTVSF